MGKDKNKFQLGKIEIRSKLKKAVYPGTFDPPTNGHIDVARRAASIFDEVIIAISDNLSKTPLFKIDERIEMLKELFKEDTNITVSGFSGLLVNFVIQENAIAIVRGLRAVSDFEYELQLASMNALLNKSVETIFFMSSDENLFVSSSVIKEIARLGGDISTKVHPVVLKKLISRFSKTE